MIHQQPPPKPPLLPQHMICHLTLDIPVTETGSDAAGKTCGAGAEPRGSPASRPAFLPVSASYYVGTGKLVPIPDPGFCPDTKGVKYHGR